MRNPLARKVDDNGTAPEQPHRSRFQIILDDLNEAHRRMDHAAHLFSTLIFDIEKGMKFIDQFRNHLTTAIEQTGGTVESNNIEQQIAEFIPKNVKAEGNG